MISNLELSPSAIQDFPTLRQYYKHHRRDVLHCMLPVRKAMTELFTCYLRLGLIWSRRQR